MVYRLLAHPMVAMEVTARKVDVLLSMGRPRMKAKQTMPHTALMGACDRREGSYCKALVPM